MVTRQFAVNLTAVNRAAVNRTAVSRTAVSRTAVNQSVVDPIAANQSVVSQIGIHSNVSPTAGIILLYVFPVFLYHAIQYVQSRLQVEYVHLVSQHHVILIIPYVFEISVKNF